MFTGITRGLCPIVDVQRTDAGLRYRVDLGALAAGVEIGASVAIDGCCQTVAAIEGDILTFDAIPETLRLTTLDALVAGRAVSVERSFRVGDEVGGHRVSGHIVGTGTIVERRTEGSEHALVIAHPVDWCRYIRPKGFIAVDGSSLTIGFAEQRAAEGRFSLHLVPETLRLTALGTKAIGDRVNIELESETVAIVDTVERILDARIESALDARLRELEETFRRGGSTD